MTETCGFAWRIPGRGPARQKIADKAQRVALPKAGGTLVWYFAASLFRFKHVYHTERPHSSLGDVPPAAFRSEFEARSREKGLRFSGCSPIFGGWICGA
jgi:hypothetical protein